MVSSVVLFIRNRKFMLLSFALVVPLSSRLMKLDLSMRAIQMLHDIQRDYFSGYFERIPPLYIDMGEVTSTLS